MNPLTPVSKLMSTKLITVMKDTPVNDMISLLQKHRINHLPVVTADRKLTGIVSQTDISKLVQKSASEIEALSCGDIMTSGLAKLEPTDTVATAANLFMLNKFHALPVIEGDTIVGMLTTLDLIKLIDEEVVELKDYSDK